MENKNCLLEIRDLNKSFGDKQVVHNMSMCFSPASFTCIVGKSGCGKTTFLKMLAGLELMDSGTINLNANHHKIGMVFQEPRLMPWLTVSENITFASKNDTTLSKDKLPEILEALELTDAANLYPHQLSGGMAQRVSLGRTLFFNPDIILMDEPFSAVDYFTRQSLQRTLLKLFSQEQKTIIFVTHDVEEALVLGDEVLVMDKGTIKSAIKVDLPRPREASNSELQLLRQQILHAL